MNNVQTIESRIPPMSAEAVNKVEQLTEFVKAMPQFPLETHHVIHGGMYCRTITMPPNHVLTGALVKVSTILVINGVATCYIGEETIAEIAGYGVISASAGRKQAFVSHSKTDISMVFPTNAKTVFQAEQEFTDESDLLLSRSDIGSNIVTITGE